MPLNVKSHVWERTSSPPARPPDCIHFVGDSITLGWGDEQLGGWPMRLLRRLAGKGHPVTGYNLGIRGDTSEGILRRWRDETARRHRGSALLVLAFGVNDAKVAADGSLPITPEQTARNLRRILGDAGRHRVVVIGPAPIDEDLMHRQLNGDGLQAMPSLASIAAVNSRMAAEAELAGIPFLDLLTMLSSDGEWARLLAATDGLHPSAHGHDRIAEIVGDWPAWTELFPGGGARGR